MAKRDRLSHALPSPSKSRRKLDQSSVEVAPDNVAVKCNIPTRPTPVFLITRYDQDFYLSEKPRVKLLRFMKKILRDCKKAVDENLRGGMKRACIGNRMDDDGQILPSPLEDYFVKQMLNKARRLKKGSSQIMKYCTSENDPSYRFIFRAYLKAKEADPTIDDLACTESSPINTDAKNKFNKKRDRMSKEKSWNENYVTWLMAHKVLREFYLYYIDFLNEGKSDSTGMKFAKELGLEPREGLYVQFQQLFYQGEPGEEHDTTLDESAIYQVLKDSR